MGVSSCQLTRRSASLQHRLKMIATAHQLQVDSSIVWVGGILDQSCPGIWTCDVRRDLVTLRSKGSLGGRNGEDMWKCAGDWTTGDRESIAVPSRLCATRCWSDEENLVAFNTAHTARWSLCPSYLIRYVTKQLWHRRSPRCKAPQCGSISRTPKAPACRQIAPREADAYRYRSTRALYRIVYYGLTPRAAVSWASSRILHLHRMSSRLPTAMSFGVPCSTEEYTSSNYTSHAGPPLLAHAATQMKEK